jgi:hypothetical protein
MPGIHAEIAFGEALAGDAGRSGLFAGGCRASRQRPAAVEVTAEVVAGAISTSGHGLQLVQRQFSDEFCLIEIRHFNLPYGCTNASLTNTN